MPYADHLLVNFGGTVGTADPEIWSCGIRLWAPDFTGFDEIGYATDVAKPALAAWMARPTSKISSHCQLDWLKVNVIGSDGLYQEPENPHTYFYTPSIAGAVAGTGMPYQACVVLSWRSLEATRGPGTKGRIYSPAPAVSPVAATGLFAAADAQGMATSAATLLNTLDIALSDDSLRPAIMSNIGAIHHQIDTVLVDNRVDIQRRRANALVAVASTAPVVY